MTSDDLQFAPMTLPAARQALKKYFGYETFRPMQGDIIQAVFDKKDVLVLMPTGGGKSLCFQIPAVSMPGTTIVVSPLISLMKDQVEGLRANGISAAYLNSSLDSMEVRQVEDDLFNGNLDLFYISPEKLVSHEFMPLLKKVKVNLFAIDEAHCISGWGHDFRPEYTKLNFLKELFPEVPVIALTATADKVTRRDILKQLSIEDAEVFLSSFDRPNLSLEVRPGRKRIEQIISYVKEKQGESGIIYCLSRKSCEDVAGKLLSRGIKADFYHGAMSAGERSQVQENFINDVTPVVCATIAFGMGIDKSNVRYVIHYNLPRNMEGYYQEIGRAGRDGVNSETILFYSFADVLSYRRMYEQDFSEQTQLKLAKLDRMYQYAAAQVCRRKILLNYFNEHLREDCGNCDICKNPPSVTDGTVNAQKALSAVVRAKETVGINLLINILRGSKSQGIYAGGYHNIKTYGVGADLSFEEWRHLIEQYIHLGFLDIAHDDGNKLKVSPAGKEILFDGRKIEVVSYESYKKREEDKKKKKVVKSERERVRDGLFEHLRKLRTKLAREQGVPPYVVFSDATLEEMAATRPIDQGEMLAVSGVGEQKMERYGQQFMDAIMGYAKINNIPLSTFKNQRSTEIVIPEEKPKRTRPKEDIPPGFEGLTTLERTLKYYNQGKTVAEIAEIRKVSEATILGHFMKMYQDGAPFDIFDFVDKEEVHAVIDKIPGNYNSEDRKLKPLHEALGEKINYGVIKWAIVYHEKRMKELPQ